MTAEPFLLIGLGNPGREYRDNRHNFGFMLVDRLCVRLNARGLKLQSKAIVTSAVYEGRKLLLAKPQTYMNLSGQAIQGLAHFYKLELDQLLVAHDDLDIPFGAIRIRPGGGPGGQKGVASAIERLGTKDFARLRLGLVVHRAGWIRRTMFSRISRAASYRMSPPYWIGRPTPR